MELIGMGQLEEALTSFPQDLDDLFVRSTLGFQEAAAEFRAAVAEFRSANPRVNVQVSGDGDGSDDDANVSRPT
ncbi:MAG: hypothetical protein U5O39_00385 [Gammaproteobacteria bacterium]|nr:hypothetical protein [Gammaproteobacteria bacterium]